MACETLSPRPRVTTRPGHGRTQRTMHPTPSHLPWQLPVRTTVHASCWTPYREGLCNGRRRHLHGTADASRYGCDAIKIYPFNCHKSNSSAKITFSLSFAFFPFPNIGWASAYTIEAILMQFAASLVKGQGRICRKTKVNKEFNRRTAEEAFRSLVKTHDKYGWITPSLSDG